MSKHLFTLDLTHVASLEAVDALIPEHKLFVQKYYDQGVFLASGAKVPRTGGVIWAIADSKAEIERIIAQDPLSQEGVSEYYVTEFVPSKVAFKTDGQVD